MKRRELLLIGAGAFSGIVFPNKFWKYDDENEWLNRLAALEKQTGGRLGVAVLDTGSDEKLLYRGDERFPMCSTFKLLLVAHILSRVDASHEQLSRVISYGENDLLEYAPITRKNLVSGGMTVSALCEAAITVSDNTAANLLLQNSGGPKGLTSYLRTIGDHTTRLDRIEPKLNSALPGDPRDTTTPNAMAATMRKLLVDKTLSSPSRQLLIGWLEACTTGSEKLRAGLPSSWRVGDKTGSGAHGSSNDVAIVWPANQKPVLITTYLTQTGPSAELNKAFADVGRIAADWIGK